MKTEEERNSHVVKEASEGRGREYFIILDYRFLHHIQAYFACRYHKIFSARHDQSRKCAVYIHRRTLDRYTPGFYTRDDAIGQERNGSNLFLFPYQSSKDLF